MPKSVPDTRMYYFHPPNGMGADFAYAAFSRGWAGLIALLAVAVEPAAGVVVSAEGFPASYAEIALSDQYAQPVSLMVPGACRISTSRIYWARSPRTRF